MKTKPLAFPPSEPVPIRVKQKVPSQKFRSKTGNRQLEVRLRSCTTSSHLVGEPPHFRRHVGERAHYTQPRSWHALATRPIAMA